MTLPLLPWRWLLFLMKTFHSLNTTVSGWLAGLLPKAATKALLLLMLGQANQKNNMGVPKNAGVIILNLRRRALARELFSSWRKKPIPIGVTVMRQKKPSWVL